MSQSTNLTPADALLIPATDPAATVGLFFTVAELRAAMSPVGYMTPANEINAAAAQAAQLTANAAIPSASLGQPLGPIQSDATNKIPLANLPASVIGSSHYLGTWNALTNTPVITSGVAPVTAAPVGGYFIVSTAGSPVIDGISVWNVGDWAIWDGAHWGRIAGQTNPVTSVAGLIGAVSAPQISAALNLGGASLLRTNVASGVPVLDSSGNFAGQSVGANLDASPTVAALYTYPFAGLSDRSRVRAASYSTSGDGGGDDFLWLAASTLADDSAYTINPTGNTGNGRWIRQRRGPIDIIACGAQVGIDISSALNRANSIASTLGTGILVPRPPSGRQWTLSQPVTITATSLVGESFVQGNSNETQIYFNYSGTIIDTPSTITSAITIAGNCEYVANICGVGPDGASAAQQQYYVTGSGPSNITPWVLTQAQFTATISGNTLTVLSIVSGTIAIGAQDTNSISGNGMGAAPLGSVAITALVSGTSGGVGVYTISGASQNVARAITITQTLLPTMAALRPGTAFFNCATSVIFENCSTNNSKYGRVIANAGGHVRAFKCAFSGFLGTHFAVNNGDYKDYECDNLGGGWACYSSYCGSTNLAFEVRTFGGHIGFGLFGFYAFTTGSSGFGFGNIHSFATSYEAFGEAAYQFPPTFNGTAGFWLYGCQQGSLKSTYGVTTDLVPVPRTYYMQFLGSITNFKAEMPNSGYGTFPNPAGGLGIANIGSISLTTDDMDLDAFQGNWTIGNPSSIYGGATNKRLGRYSRSYVQRSEYARVNDFATSGNLLQNPEVPSGWTLNGTTYGTQTLATFIAANPTVAIPQKLYEEGPLNSVVISLTASRGFNAYLKVLSGLSWNQARSVGFRCWVYAPSGCGINVYGNGGNLSTVSLGANSTSWQLCSQDGMLFSDGTSTAVSYVNFGSSANDIIYIIAPMLALDTLKGYNQLSTPYARSGISIGNENAGLTASQAIEILPFNGIPGGTYPNGSVGINVAATNIAGMFYQYVTGSGWTQFGQTPSTGQSVFTSSGTYTPSAGMQYCEVTVIGCGGAGGGGAMGAPGTAMSGGGGGGGGQLALGRFTAAQIGASIQVTLGLPGRPGTGATANGAGGAGVIGTASFIGSSASPLLRAQPAGAGGGGQVGNVSIGGTSPGIIYGGVTASIAQPSGGFLGGSGVTGGVSTAIDIGGGGGGSNSANSVSGGGGAAFRFGGGGSGGSVTAAGVAAAGGVQGQSSVQTAAPGGANIGANGTNGVTVDNQFSQGGSGGGASLSGVGGAGGVGAFGAGGAGGGAGIRGGGAGGAGGAPIIIITEFF